MHRLRFQLGQLAAGGGGRGKSRAGEGGEPVAMAAGTAGAQSAGTWSSGHGRGLAEGEEEGDEATLPLPLGLYHEESFQEGRSWELQLPPGECSSPGGLRASQVPTRAMGQTRLVCPLQSSCSSHMLLLLLLAEAPQIVNSGSVILTQSPGLPAPVAKATAGQRAAQGARSSKSESQLLKPKNKQLKRRGGGWEGG